MLRSLLTLAAVPLLLSRVPAHAEAQPVVGAGSSFAMPLYEDWSAQARPSVALDYHAVGSGAGQAAAIARSVDFGASDVPMPPSQLKAGHLVQFPTAVGGIAVIVNLPGVDVGQVRLTGAVLAGIYAGRIKDWGDPAIRDLNPGLSLPSLAVVPVYRADGSGMTAVFTDYLAGVDASWRQAVQSGIAVAWPAGSGARGSVGMIETVSAVPGAIGYVEASYALRRNLGTPQLANHDGQFVRLSAQSVAEASAAADWRPDLGFAVDLNDRPGAASWPIVSATYVVLPEDGPRAGAVLGLFGWAFDRGDEAAQGAGFVPLPPAVKAKVTQAWREAGLPVQDAAAEAAGRKPSRP